MMTGDPSAPTVTSDTEEETPSGGKGRFAAFLRGLNPRQRLLSFCGAVLASLVAAYLFAWLPLHDHGPSRSLVIANQVTNGPIMKEDTQPVLLSTVPVNFCAQAQTCVPGVALHSGDKVEAICQRSDGPVTTNGNLQDPGDDANPDLVVSRRWYKVRWHGIEGFVSEAWVRADDRGGKGLPTCS